MEILNKGGLLCILPDFPGTFVGEEETYREFICDLKAPTSKLSKYSVSFLGEKIYVSAGVVYLSHMLNIPVVFGVIRRCKRLHHLLTFKEINFPGDCVAINEKIKIIFKMIEEEIEEKPYQWGLWSHLHKSIVAASSE